MSYDDKNCWFEKRSDYYLRTAINEVTGLNISDKEFIGDYPRELIQDCEGLRLNYTTIPTPIKKRYFKCGAYHDKILLKYKGQDMVIDEHDIYDLKNLIDELLETN